MGDSFGGRGKRRRPSNGGNVAIVVGVVAVLAAAYVVGHVVSFPSWWPF